MRVNTLTGIAAGVALALGTAVRADTVRLDQLEVIGSKEAARQLPGSGHYIDEESLETFNYTDINRILREVPGIYVQEEDGFGLRPNIGLRGTGTERSSNITLMEDGVLIAPAPYASPAAYYFPSAGRMSAVEVVKGPAAIKYGPRTLGGAINLISRPIPFEAGGQLDVSGGEFGTYKLHGYYGESTQTTGAVVELLRQQSSGFKELDTGGNTGFRKNDLLSKFRINSPSDAAVYQELELKLGYTDELSNETYLGLTDADFRADPFRRYAGSQKDQMDAEHKQIQLSHHIQPTQRVSIDTDLYYNTFHRNWYKLDKVDGASIADVLSDPATFANELAVLKGASGSLDVKANNREYYSQGIQSALGLSLPNQEITIGARYHEDAMDRFQWVDTYAMNNGSMTLATPGIPGTDSNRIDSARATALYVQDKIRVGKWQVLGGVRYEDIKMRREDYGKSDPGRDVAPSVTTNSTQVVIPGAGLTYDVTPELSLLAGVHKGFAPVGPGNSDQADAEESINYELGARFERGNMHGELIGFYNDYENLLGDCTASSGCTGGDIGDQFNAGNVNVKGVEALLGYNLVHGAVAFPLQLGYTYTDAQFRTSFADGFWGTVEAGDELPYMPDHRLYARLGVAKEQWDVYMTANYTSAMRTEAGSGAIPAQEKVDAHTVLDLAGRYRIGGNSSVYLKVDNLLDKEYVAARDPAGVRPGMPRLVQVGYKLEF